MNIEWLRARDWWSRVDQRGPDDCWPWKMSTGSHGYGQTWDGSTVLLAHRVAWTLTNGPIPEGMTIDHECRRRPCCNPGHLRLMSNVENAKLNGNAVKNECKYGHTFDKANTGFSVEGHRRCLTCQNRRNLTRPLSTMQTSFLVRLAAGDEPRRNGRSEKGLVVRGLIVSEPPRLTPAGIAKVVDLLSAT